MEGPLSPFRHRSSPLTSSQTRVSGLREHVFCAPCGSYAGGRGGSLSREHVWVLPIGFWSQRNQRDGMSAEQTGLLISLVRAQGAANRVLEGLRVDRGAGHGRGGAGFRELDPRHRGAERRRVQRLPGLRAAGCGLRAVGRCWLLQLYMPRGSGCCWLLLAAAGCCWPLLAACPYALLSEGCTQQLGLEHRLHWSDPPADNAADDSRCTSPSPLRRCSAGRTRCKRVSPVRTDLSEKRSASPLSPKIAREDYMERQVHFQSSD